MVNRQAVFVLLLCFLASLPALGRLNVWAIGDGVRVNPQTGKLIEERLDIQKDYPTGNYRQKNFVWDGATRTVSV